MEFGRCRAVRDGLRHVRYVVREAAGALKDIYEGRGSVL